MSFLLPETRKEHKALTLTMWSGLTLSSSTTGLLAGGALNYRKTCRDIEKLAVRKKHTIQTTFGARKLDWKSEN